MKKFLLSGALIGTLGAITVNAQQHVHHAGCGSNYRLALQDPEFAAEQAKFTQYLAEYAYTPGEKSDGYRIMPVVVHIIHNGGSSNVSQANINTMIDHLNKAFSRTPANINTLPTSFDTLAGEAKIKFRLATKDPMGRCTDGVRRVYAPHKSENAYDDKMFKRLSYWDRSKYLNIWIVNNITDPSDAGGTGTILGYCLFPSNAPALRDGAVIAYGSMTTQAVVPHEIGHHLNLIHMWGDQNCGSDEVDDTPIHKSTNFDWPNPCASTVKEATCYEDIVDNTRDSLLRFAIGENYQNYMDYVNNYNCPNMFTHGQIERMNAALDYYTFRKSVVTHENNVLTGTDDDALPCTDMIPVAEFWATNNIVCEGSTVNFTDGSFNGTPTSWEWDFGDGSTSNLQNPTHTYAEAGTYSVTLKVSNANGEFTTKTKESAVYVLNNEVESKGWGYTEGFEGGGNYDQGRWTIINHQTDAGKSWVLSLPNHSYGGSFSIKMNNFQNVRDNNSTMISPAVNMDALPGGDGKAFRFKVAYALRTNEEFGFDEISQSYLPVINDRLVLSRSTNCGSSWVTIKTFTTAELLSAGLFPNAFSPASLSDWKQVSVPLNGTLGNGSNVRYRLHFTSGGPLNNNMYIDDIQIVTLFGGLVDINEATVDNLSLSVYPNPVTDNSIISFNLPFSISKANIGVYDITGRYVANVYSGDLMAGEQTFTLSRERVAASGVYFVKVELDGKVLTQKIVAQ